MKTEEVAETRYDREAVEPAPGSDYILTPGDPEARNWGTQYLLTPLFSFPIGAARKGVADCGVTGPPRKGPINRPWLRVVCWMALTPPPRK